MVSYADGNAPRNFSLELDPALRRYRNYKLKIYEWFHKSCFKSNADNKTLSQLGINNDGQLNLNYTSQLCKRTNQKIHDLTGLNK